jgi:hypothetical protein
LGEKGALVFVARPERPRESNSIRARYKLQAIRRHFHASPDRAGFASAAEGRSFASRKERQLLIRLRAIFRRTAKSVKMMTVDPG